MARLDEMFAFLAKCRLRAALEEVEKIVSWRAQWLREWASRAYAGGRHMAWDMAIRLEMMGHSGSGMDPYVRRVKALHRKLGVPADYARRGLPFQRETSDLVAVPCALDGQCRWMTPATRTRYTKRAQKTR